MIMTPFAPLDPYRALEAASLSTLMDSISLTFIALKSPENGFPSTTYSGELEALMEPIPRIRMVAEVPG
ncbi:hypothetical protein D3C86_1734540 [compost metagenome]